MSDTIPGDLELRYRQISSELPPHTQLIAVSKGVDPGLIRLLYDLGHRDFGENYVQELRTKAAHDALQQCQNLRWHFLGHLQTNKVRAVLPLIHCIHSLDSVRLMTSVQRELEKTGGRMKAFLQVKEPVSPTKTGFTTEELTKISPDLRFFTRIEILGLMALPELGDASEFFRHVQQLELRLRPITQGQLSMGMSGDYNQAIRFGASYVRLGTALFGKRAT